MPELPDVEVYRKYLSATSLHKRIEGVHVAAPALLHETTPQGLGRALKHRQFETARRHGKYLLARLDKDRWLVLHFGMSGSLKYFKTGDGDVPRRPECLIVFENGYALAYIAPRKLGLITLVDSPRELIESRKLGPDAMSLDREAFMNLAAGHKGSVKSWLMDQNNMAGIGNIYSDEILFQAGIHPRCKMQQLDKAALGKLYRAMRRVLPAAIRAGAQPENMPSSFILPQRTKGGRCPGCGGALKHGSVGGRTAWFCPDCQPPCSS